MKLTNGYEPHRASSTPVAPLKSKVNARPRDRDARSLRNPQSLVDIFEEAVDALFVDALGSFEDLKIDADGSCEMHEGLEGLEIFREAEAAEAQASTKELAANAGIEPHGLRDFFHIRANFFAEVGDNVGVADFQGEERIGRMLDQLRAVDGGDQERGSRAIRAEMFVNRAAELALENRAIDLAHLSGGGLDFHAYDDAVRMKEIPDGGAFAKELW